MSIDRNTSDIGMMFFSPTYLSPISEQQMSMSMSDIADIEIDVDAHLWSLHPRHLDDSGVNMMHVLVGIFRFKAERWTLGCFRKCHFGIPQNTEFYTELVLFHVIPRNSAKFFTVQFRRIPCRFVYTEFRIPSNENTIIEPITKDL
jgi:hypothetical protein